MYLSLNIKNTRLLHVSVSSQNAVSQYSIERSIDGGECCPLLPWCVHHSWATLREQRLFLREKKRCFLRPRSSSAHSRLSCAPLPLLGLCRLGVDCPKERHHLWCWPCGAVLGSQVLRDYPRSSQLQPGQSLLPALFLDLCVRSSALHLLPSFWSYLHSLVIHSESSRQEDPMGLRETPLQNGVILRGLLLDELSSSMGEPSTCRAKIS